jgi:hypothetical protein
MKRISKLFLTTFVILAFSMATSIFAQDNNTDDEYGDGDVYDDGTVEEVYEQNGAGDQFISLKLMPCFPLNFGKQLYVGGALSVGYHRFLTKYIALGGDFLFGYNPTIGSNIFTYVPLTLAVTFQPYIGKFEFPIKLGVGFAVENYLSMNYFPGLIIKPELGAHYRFNENWSFGIEGQFMYMPQWFVEHPENDSYGLFIMAALSARYHF